MFEQIDVKSLELNPFNTIQHDTFLVTAGTEDEWNTMTAGWGFLGVMWARPAFGIVIRASRYTYEFLEKSSSFTCSFFPPEWKKALQFCGSHSGRTTNKEEATSLTSVVVPGTDLITFEQANLVFCCTQASRTNIEPSDFLLPEIEKHYPKKDYHRLYIGFIDQMLAKE